MLRHRYRGMMVGACGVGLMAAILGLSDYLSDPLVGPIFTVAFAVAAAGWVVQGWDIFHHQQRVDADERRIWIREHCDPDRRDDPADSVKGS